MDNKNNVTFEDIFEQNKRRIHYHIHKLRINDPHQEFYQEALFAMWNAYKTYQPDKGIMSTYFNYTIHNRLIDLLRKKTREQEHEDVCVQEIGNRTYNSNRIRKNNTLIPDFTDIPIDDFSTLLWEQVRSLLTENQWKWVYHYIILNMSVKEIAEQEGVTIDAVKSQGKRVRKKLREAGLREMVRGLGDDLN
ncbi:sigma-70 family RNA polymerase sigma factor [Virgibacillus necropolis]|uniref:sigma-70 family RNA polymerase sigma factor n=1 Tax=Virgibacillus necropolis TaxID=163877 RepID=UPI003850BF3F